MKKLYHRLMHGVKKIQKKGVRVGKTVLARSLAQKKYKKENKKTSAKKGAGYASSYGSHCFDPQNLHATPLQILKQDGSLDATPPKLTIDQIKEMYRLMVLSRAFDDIAVKLQRQGRLGTYGSVRGQEASQIGSAYALQKDDWLVPSFRENASCIARGMPMKCLFQYWGGDERGHTYTESKTTLPLSIPISTQVPHGVGIAMAIQYKKEKKVVLTHMGDGGTSEGDFHEALNFAGVFKAPVVFLCQNNQWAISVPRSKQTAAETLAQKALAYGFPGVLVDGNDIFAVYQAVSDAAEKARNGNGPTLIECITYRMSDHTTADDAKRYRSQEEVEQWIKKDPINRLKNYMLKKKMWDAKKEAVLQEEVAAEVSAAVRAYENEPEADARDIFAYTFAIMSQQLQEQYQSLQENLEKKEKKETLEKIPGGFP